MRFLRRAGAGFLVFLLALPIVGCSNGSSGGGFSVNAALNAARAAMLGPGPPTTVLGPASINPNIEFSVVQLPVTATVADNSEGTTIGAGRLQGLAPGQPIRYQYQFFAPEAGIVGLGFRFGPAGPIWMIDQPAGTETLVDGNMTLDLEFPVDIGVCESMMGRCGTFEVYAYAIYQDPDTLLFETSEPAIVSSALSCDIDCIESSCGDLIASCNTNVIVQTVVTSEVENLQERGCFSGTLEHTITNAPPASVFTVEASWNATVTGTVAPSGTVTVELPTPLHCPCLEGSLEFFLDGVSIGTTSDFGAQFLVCANP